MRLHTHTHTYTPCVSLRTNTTAGTSLTVRGTCDVTRTEQATSSTKRNAERALEYLAAVTSPIVPGRCPGRAVGLRCSSFVVAATLTPVCARRQLYHKPAGRGGQALRPLMAYRVPVKECRARGNLKLWRAWPGGGRFWGYLYAVAAVAGQTAPLLLGGVLA